MTTLYPLIRHSLIANYLEMTTIEYRDTDVRSSELDTGLSSSGESMDKDFEIVVSKPLLSSKPSSSSSSILFHAFSESCSLEQRHLKSIRKRFQFPRRIVRRLPRSNGKACSFAHGEVSLYEATFSCSLHFLFTLSSCNFFLFLMLHQDNSSLMLGGRLLVVCQFGYLPTMGT